MNVFSYCRLGRYPLVFHLPTVTHSRCKCLRPSLGHVCAHVCVCVCACVFHPRTCAHNRAKTYVGVAMDAACGAVRRLATPPLSARTLTPSLCLLMRTGSVSESKSTGVPSMLNDFTRTSFGHLCVCVRARAIARAWADVSLPCCGRAKVCAWTHASETASHTSASTRTSMCTRTYTQEAARTPAARSASANACRQAQARQSAAARWHRHRLTRA